MVQQRTKGKAFIVCLILLRPSSLLSVLLTIFTAILSFFFEKIECAQKKGERKLIRPPLKVF